MSRISCMSFRYVHLGIAGALVAAVWTSVGLVQASGTGTASVFIPVTPCRLVDTRPAPDHVGVRATALGNAESVDFQVGGTNGNCTIPTAATAIAANVTAVRPTSPGYLTVFPAGDARPLTSSVNFVAGEEA